ncbi:hypothetical protein [uncultured Sphingobacterium sp.]|uniref:hypothetical protein n=1 Tax=uncultured Sphingobacterium sp. TaxID=182688 RepID=UPI0025E4A520|nr:hypothetical protein [uncultured Sphingobacterium sp.]
MDNPDIIEPFLKSKLVKELESKKGNILSVYHFILVPVIFGNLVLIQCFEIAERFCQAQEMRDMVKVYAETFQKERLNIEKFINETLILESDLIPQLIKNRPNYE